MRNNRYYAVVKKTGDEITHYKYTRKEQRPDGSWRYYYKDDNKTTVLKAKKSDPFEDSADAIVDLLQPLEGAKETLYEKDGIYKKIMDFMNTPVRDLFKSEKKILGNTDEIQQLTRNRR